MRQLIEERGQRPIKLWTDVVEDSAMQQLRNVASLPFIHAQGIAVMPDVHTGIGATVGCVIPTEGAIIPAAVGVDIGCGMVAVRTSLGAADLPDSLSRLRHAIERGVPLGAGGRHLGKVIEHNYARLPHSTRGVAPLLDQALGAKWQEKASAQLGTLGSGNHFIEICLDQEDRVWAMLHSGSRGTGNMIGRYFIEKAKKEMERFFISLPDADLAYFAADSADFDRYVAAVRWAQDYAMENRRAMMAEVVRNLRFHIKRPFTLTDEAINCHHNYVEREHHFGRDLWVTRKGAIRARAGELGIIPGSMGQRSFIVRGKGNAEAYHSCSHGAGRSMSRTAARKRFTIADLAQQTEGVECRKDAAVLDEIPGAYKSIDAVMANQHDLVEVVHTLKQVLCVKGA